MWQAIEKDQDNRVNKLKTANERLNLLIKQCCNEPVSGFTARNVREKCQSFLTSSSEQELWEGLKKYESRQRRVIKLLKHKESKLSKEYNLLEIAKDQTADDGLFYVSIIASSGNQYFSASEVELCRPLEPLAARPMCTDTCGRCHQANLQPHCLSMLSAQLST